MVSVHRSTSYSGDIDNHVPFAYMAKLKVLWEKHFYAKLQLQNNFENAIVMVVVLSHGQ